MYPVDKRSGQKVRLKAMTSAVQVSLDEYLASTYEPDREYVSGKLVVRNMGESDHTGLQAL